MTVDTSSTVAPPQDDAKGGPADAHAGSTGITQASFWRMYVSAWAVVALVGIWWAYS